MKTRIIFIIFWIAFILGLILRSKEISGGLIVSMLSSFALTIIYFVFSRRILIVPKDQQKAIWLIYVSGIVWGYSILSILFIVSSYPGARIMAISIMTLLVGLLVLTSYKKPKLWDKMIFIRLIFHSILMLAIIGISYIFFL